MQLIVRHSSTSEVRSLSAETRSWWERSGGGGSATFIHLLEHISVLSPRDFFKPLKASQKLAEPQCMTVFRLLSLVTVGDYASN